jgi:hypothetical protein
MIVKIWSSDISHKDNSGSLITSTCNKIYMTNSFGNFKGLKEWTPQLAKYII